MLRPRPNILRQMTDQRRRDSLCCCGGTQLNRRAVSWTAGLTTWALDKMREL